MTDGEQIQARLADAQQDRNEHRQLSERLAALGRDVEMAEQAVSQARTKLVDEQADVDRLESFSPTRIIAGLKGDRLERLDKELAEQRAAEYAVATAEARCVQVQAECDDVRRRLEGLGDVEAQYQQVLADKEGWLTTVDPAVGASLASVATRVGELRNEHRELREADAAARQAFQSLRDAAGLLESAKSWSTYDTFFGGGLIADLQKHQRLDDATTRMHAADATLKRLATELADVGVQPVGGIGISDLSRTFDVWFDNIFSDLGVRDRIMQASGRVHAALAALDGVGGQLADRRTAVEAALAQCAVEREGLLGG